MTPEEEALTILERLRDGGLWQPAGLGLSYVRSGEKELKLTEQENNPTSAQARIRMRILIEKLGWRVDESEAQLIDVQHLSPQERHMQEMMMRQEAAQGWKCECGTPLSAFPLEEGVWTHDGQQEMRLPTGDVEMVEQWSVVISCPVCDKKIPTEPYDYALVLRLSSEPIYYVTKPSLGGLTKTNYWYSERFVRTTVTYYLLT
jgi:hypothetical protein